MEPNPYGGGAGGAGGKVRRRASRPGPSTPYDRPAPAAPHGGATGGSSGGWLSRIVDPASRLISGGASRLLSSVMKRLPALPAPEMSPLPPPLEMVPEDAAPTPGPSAGGHVELDHDAREGVSTIPAPILENKTSSASFSDGKVFSELEQLLQQRTFTRAEFDHLTNLLRSRTVEPVQLKALSYKNVDEKNDLPFSVKGNVADHSKLGGNVPNYLDDAADTVDEYAAPAELAKAFMHSVSAKGSPAISLRSRTPHENKVETSIAVYEKKTLGGADHSVPAAKTLPGNVMLSENGYTTPQLRGRSAIYRMARSPYFKGTHSSKEMFATPMSSLQAPISFDSSNKQSLKRRSSVLELEIGPGDSTIRRIRQKSNMMSPRKNVDSGVGSSFPPGGRDAANKQILGSSKRLPETTQYTNFHRPEKINEDMVLNKPASTEKKKVVFDSIVRQVPPQSSRTAEQIFKHLEEMTRSPKDTLFEMVPDKSELLSAKAQRLHPGESSKTNLDSQVHQELKSVAPVDAPSGSRLGITKDLGGKKDEFLKQCMDSSPAAVGFADTAPVRTAPKRGPGFKLFVDEFSMEVDDHHHNGDMPSSNATTTDFQRIQEQKVDSSSTELNGTKKLDLKKAENVPNGDDKKAKVHMLDQKNEPKPSMQYSGTSGKYADKFAQLPSSKDGLSSASAAADSAVNKAIASGESNFSFTFPLIRQPGALTEPPPTPTMPSSPPAAPAHGNGPVNSPLFAFGAKSNSVPALESTSTVSRSDFSISKPSHTPDGVDSVKAGEKYSDGASKLPFNFSPPGTTVSAPSFAFGKSLTSDLSNGTSHSAMGSFPSSTGTLASGQSVSPLLPTSESSSLPVSSASPAFSTLPTFQFSSNTSTGIQIEKSEKSDHTDQERNPIIFGAGTAIVTAEKASSPFTSISTSPSSQTQSIPSTVGQLDVSGTNANTSASSTSSTVMAGVQSAPSSSVAFSPAGSSIFGATSAAQSTVFSPVFTGNTSQASSLSGQTSTMNALSSQASSAGSSSSIFSSTLSKPTQSSAGIFSFGSEKPASGMVFGSTASSSNSSAPFSFTASPLAPSPTPQSSAAPSLFSSTSLASSSSPFSSTFGSTSSAANPFAFGQSTSGSTSFGTQAPTFSFGAAAIPSSSSPAPVFGTPNNGGFSTNSPGCDQMNEDAMADDTSHSNPSVPIFGQPPSSPAAPVFGAFPTQQPVFGAPASPPGSTPFQFGSNVASTPQNPISFQAGSAAPDFQGGGGFSLGSGGGDKSNRRIVKVSRKLRKK